MTRLVNMRVARLETEGFLGMALEILDEPVNETATPEQAARTRQLVTSYIQLAGEAINRFQEAAHGA